MRTKIWLGIGLTAAAGSLAVAGLPAEAGPAHGKHGTLLQVAANEADTAGRAQGGEGGESGAEITDPGLAVLRGITLTRGHYRVGDELVVLGRWDDAVPHFHHPSEEIYGDIAGKLSVYGIADFQGPMKALAQTIAAKSPEAYKAARAVMRGVLDDAEKRLMAKESARARALTLQTIVSALQVAGAEYQAAVDPKKPRRIANPVEYQDSRGFVIEAEAMFEALAADPALATAAATRKIRATFADIKQAWPSVLPPKRVTRPAPYILGGAAMVELTASRLPK